MEGERESDGRGTMDEKRRKMDESRGRGKMGDGEEVEWIIS